MLGLRSLALALCLWHASAFAGVVSTRGGAVSSQAAVGGAWANAAATPRRPIGAGNQQRGEMPLPLVGFRACAGRQSLSRDYVSNHAWSTPNSRSLLCWYHVWPVLLRVYYCVFCLRDVFARTNAQTNECVQVPFSLFRVVASTQAPAADS